MSSDKNFDYILNKMPSFERNMITQFFINLYKKLNLNPKKNELIIEDFKRAILYYYFNNWKIEDILNLISIDNLGDFYLKESDTWYPLDNGAKIFPLSMTGNWMAVYRISVYLNERVVPEILQLALNFTIKRFPYFATILKKGFFWNYIDSNMRRYRIRPELNKPCSCLKVSKYNSQSFKVRYYKNRISVEFFHALTDGTGGMVFLKTLVAEYLRLLGKDIPATDGVMDINAPPHENESSDDYKKAESIKTTGSLANVPALQIGGNLARHRPYKVLHFTIDAKKFVTLAHTKNATVTTLMLAYIFSACKNAIPVSHGNIQIQVPINARKYYQSVTMRNLSLFATIKVSINEVDDFNKLIENIKNQLTKQTQKENLDNSINLANNYINKIKYLPLIFKRLITLSVRNLGTLSFTNTLSNLGNIKTPDEMYKHIDKMDFILGNPTNNRVSCAMVTYNNKMVLSIAKSVYDKTFEETLYNLLKKDNLEIIVQGSEPSGR